MLISLRKTSDSNLRPEISVGLVPWQKLYEEQEKRRKYNYYNNNGTIHIDNLKETNLDVLN